MATALCAQAADSFAASASGNVANTAPSLRYASAKAEYGDANAASSSMERRKNCFARSWSAVLPSPSCHRPRSEEHTSELQSRRDLVCRLLLEKKKKRIDL